MALAATKVTGGTDQTAGTSFQSASVSPTADALLILHVVAHDDEGSPGLITGWSGSTNWASGLTWNLIGSADIEYLNTAGQYAKHMWYWAIAPSSVTAGIIQGNTSVTHEDFMWYLTEFTDTATPSYVQGKIVSGSGSTIHTGSLDATPTAGNGIVAFGSIGENAIFNGYPTADMTDLGFTLTGSAPWYVSECAYDFTAPLVDPFGFESNTSADNNCFLIAEVGQPAAASTGVVVTAYNDIQ